jgi:hypothetical protein
MRNIHVKLLVIRHGPYDAELIPEIVPESAVTFILLDRTFETIGAVSTDITHIHTETLEDLLARYGKLLHRIQNRYVILYSQMGKQLGVRFFVYARLKAAQVDRDSIGDLVVESFSNALS